MGRKFVPQSTIDRRVQAKDDRLNAAIAAFRRRTTSPAPIVGADTAAFHRFLADPTTGPRLDAALAEFARIDAQLSEDDRLEDLRESDGSTCGANCGFCGRCS